MSAELSIRENGFVEMAYSGALPWHGTGQLVSVDAPIETWVAAAGMDWKIRRAFVRYPVSQDTANDISTWQKDEEHHVLFRSDTGKALAVVSPRFKVVQPAATLEFFRDLIGNAGYVLSTAGVLREGRKFWAQGEAGIEDNIVGNDVVRGKLLVATSCDGSMQTIVKNVAERVVCANTLSIALKEGGKQVKVSHKSVFNADDVKAQMGLTVDVESFEDFVRKARSLACTPIIRTEARDYLLPLLFDDSDFADPKGLAECIENKGYRKIMDLFYTSGRGSQLPGVKGTAWGLVNAVTEFVDHHRGNAGTSGDMRMDYALFGVGDKLKTQAMDRAVAMFA
jgi:phage/plasmid-like protein (TIGR03299 family)